MKTGGQPGHKRRALHHVSHPGYVIKHPVTTCDCCGESLENQPVVRVETRQVFDIPPIQLEVTQHETEVKFCSSCSAKTESAFPEDMRYQLIPFDPTKEFFHDFFDWSISEGSLWNTNEKFGTYLVETFEPQLRD